MAPDCAGDTIIPDLVNANNGGGGAGLSRKQLKQVSKRAAKFARRQATKKEDGDGETAKADQSEFWFLFLQAKIDFLLLYLIFPNNWYLQNWFNESIMCY